jgi:DNA-directed RNA polymerase specialized sigma24 family protein
MGTTAGTVKSWLHRGRAALVEELTAKEVSHG